MSSEPERSIETLLRTYSRRRREELGAPMELHPANRLLLQQEAARLRAAAPPRRVWFGWHGVFWPRFATAAAMFAAICLIIISLPPGRQHRIEQPREHMLAPRMYLSDTDQTARSSEAGLSSPSEDSSPRQEAGNTADASSSTTATSAMGAAAVGEYFVREDGLAESQTSTGTGPSQILLREFQVQRIGQSIRILDSDGSIYEGQIVTDGAGRAANDPAAPLTFRANGLSRRLQQSVAINGSMTFGSSSAANPRGIRSETTSAPASAAPVASAVPRLTPSRRQEMLVSGAASATDTSKSAEQPSKPASSRIEAKAKVGSAKEFSFHAVAR